MSVNITSQATAVVIPSVTPLEPRTNQRTRPVEASAGANPNPQDATKRQSTPETQKAAPSDRPPGKDRSIPPQTLFDASLISAEFKADLKIQIEKKSEPAAVSETPSSPPPLSAATSSDVTPAKVVVDTQKAQPATSFTQIQDPTNRSAQTVSLGTAA